MAIVVDQKAANAIGKTIPPNASIYIQNLQMRRFQKNDLKRELYILFSTYGTVLEITAVKSEKMRGQAHVLFKDVNTATQALRACQGTEFYGRSMKISYSENRSKTVAKLTGTFETPATADAQTNSSNTTRSIIPAPPGKTQSIIPAPPGKSEPAGLPSKPTGLKPLTSAAEAPSPQGTKRPRDDSDDDGDVAMEEDDDDGAMDMSESDDD